LRYPYDILLAGVGIGGPNHTTLGTVRLLRRARVAFTLSVHAAWLRRICRRVVEVDESYYTGEEDAVVYRRLADVVLREAKRAGGVAWVEDGHPLIYDDMCNDIRRRGKRHGLRVTALPAVSSLDTLVADHGVRFDSTGLQIVEATSLVLARQRLNPCFETLVLQLGWFGTSLLLPVLSHREERFAPLQSYLRRFYPAAHRVRILRARQFAGDGSPVVGCRLDRLSRQFRRIAVDSTLHLPPCDKEASWDTDLAEQTTDRRRLDQIARVGRGSGAAGASRR
jgi:siroheme synthase